MLILSLILGIFQNGLSAFPRSFLRGQPNDELLVFLLGDSQGLVGLDAEVGLNSGLVPSILDPFLSHKKLSNSLHINNGGVR